MSLGAEEALRQAEAEGLTLQRANSASGYQGVYLARNSRNGSVLYHAVLWQGGQVPLGTFATPEEAALVYARATPRNARSPTFK